MRPSGIGLSLSAQSSAWTMGASSCQVEPLLGIQGDIREGTVVAFPVSPVDKAGPSPAVRSCEAELICSKSGALLFLGGMSKDSAQPELGQGTQSWSLSLLCPPSAAGLAPVSQHTAGVCLCATVE